MKATILRHILTGALIVQIALCLAPHGRGAEPGYTTLYDFPQVSTGPVWINTDGSWPWVGVLMTGDRLYGTTVVGGSGGMGVLYSIGTDGTGFTNLHTFADWPNSQEIYPKSGLILTNGTLYGADYTGGPTGCGLVYAISTNGTGYAHVHEFPLFPDGINEDGALPSGDLILSGGTLYGVAGYGGSGGVGTVYAVGPDGNNFRVLHQFTEPEAPYDMTNIDGTHPRGTLAISPSGSTLYGVTEGGGTGASGAVFALNTDGTGFVTLYSFQSPPPGYTNDGYEPMSGLVLSGGTLYGTTSLGGSAGCGTIYSVNTDGSGYARLHDFTATTPSLIVWRTNGTPCYNIDGAVPTAPLICSRDGSTLYGTTSLGGSGAFGTIFAMRTDGTGFTVLYSCAPADSNEAPNVGGDQPNKLLLVGHTLYGTGGEGGEYGQGTVFSLVLGLTATVTATPQRPRVGDTVTVVVTVQNFDEDDAITGVCLSGPDVSVAGVVSPAGFSGPTMVPSLAPMAKASFTYLYTATNYGTVTFAATATGTGPDGVVSSPPATSQAVVIAPQVDLMVKGTDPRDTLFRGIGQFMPTPSGDQAVFQPVGSTGSSGYVVRVQNDESVARSFLLGGATNSPPSWSVSVQYGGANIIGPITGGGWTTPILAPGGYLDLQVTMAPLPTAGMSDNKSLLITAMAPDTDAGVIDSLILNATLVAIPVTVTVNAAGSPDSPGYTPESIAAGSGDIDAPLVPLTDPSALDGSLAGVGGLVADGVTPLVFRLEADAASIAQIPQGMDFKLVPSIIGGGALANDQIGQRLAVLKDGSWQPAGDVLLTADSPVAYVQLMPIRSDDLSFTGQPPEIAADFIVRDNSGIYAGDATFKLRKPPIALVHGYASPGNWGEDFKSVLGGSRPYLGDGHYDNFVITVKYGQDIDYGPINTVTSLTPLGPVYMNTVMTLRQCAAELEWRLRDAISPLQVDWALTRFDMVCHSQGGVITRMLCSASPNSTIPDPFRNGANYNRGRFHRVVTIGSPHNGSRLLHYLLALEKSQISFANAIKGGGCPGLQQLVADAAIMSKMAQAKFDPFGPQIEDLNGSGDWSPDPGAKFHLVRTLIDNGFCPTYPDSTPEYMVLGLATSTGGASVLPRGSDGIVDLDSMGGNVPPAAVADNVFTVQAANDISHADPIMLFGADSYQVSSTVVAQHVIGALDQCAAMSPSYIVFDSFPAPPLLDPSQQTLIDDYAAASPMWQSLKDRIAPAPHALDGSSSYQFQVLFPTNLPPLSDISWMVQVYDAAGITDDGVELTPGGASNSLVTVTVDDSLVGDVVLSAVYTSTSNTIVVLSPTLVASIPPVGATLTGLLVLPASIALPIGAVVSPQLVATYSDGSSSMRYADPGAVAAASSQPSVVSVDDPLFWQLNAAGSAQVSVTWSGLTAVSQITVFDSTTNAPPALSIRNVGGGQMVAAWAGFESSYLLESSSSLQQTNSWQAVPAPASLFGGWTTVPLSATNAQQFFRLRWDPSAINF